MINRRDAMLRLGQLGLGALSLPQLLSGQHAQAKGVRLNSKTRSCIFIFLWGGPPQQDLWDLKPDAPEGIRSLFKPIATNVAGIRISEQLPRLAKVMDKVAIVRSLTHRSNVHEPSVYHMLTGKINPSLRVPKNNRRRSDFPGFPSVISSFCEPGPMPTAVTVPRPIGHDGVTYAGTYAGFLGPRHDPFEPAKAPESKGQAAHPMVLPPDIDRTRLQARRGLVQLLERQDRLLNGKKPVRELDDFYEQAFRMISSPYVKRAFQLDLEPVPMRDWYGRNEYGDSFLLARRLIEAGVRIVSIIWMFIKKDGQVSNVWDNHAGYGIFGAKTGYDLLKSPACLPSFDQAYSALLTDLADRGLLDETMVVAVGEFGRTPKINKTGGRDHWGACQSALFAGGGIRGGQVYGSSDHHAAYPKDNPVSPEDFLATIYHGFGLTSDSEIHDQSGRPYPVVTGKPITSLFG
ncbi:MAG: hypothetical protein KatS3mg105_4694 [Gemmatales bacterium]|nr:MAG: hypothetical protein KatS3mg105_4694 [Gemmatales bacterium]